MRALKRNKRKCWYCLYLGEQEMQDSDGNYTGETAITYSPPIELRANISPATGQSNTEMFGNLTDYDRVIVSDNTELEIDENTIVFLDVLPIIGADGVFGQDYVVIRVAKSINSVSIALRKIAPDRKNTFVFAPKDYDGVLTTDDLLFGASYDSGFRRRTRDKNDKQVC